MADAKFRMVELNIDREDMKEASMQQQTGPPRVISLLSGATETMYRLGAGHMLVGRSHECDFPSCSMAVPAVSSSKIDVSANSEIIDEQVRALMQSEETVYGLDKAVISELSPNLIICQDHCRVCAVTPSTIEACDLGDIRQLVLKPISLSDALGDIMLIADAIGEHQRGVQLLQLLENRLSFVKTVADDALKGGRARPRVVVLEWCAPLMGCGYWIGDLISLAGGQPVFCSSSTDGESTPSIPSFEALIAAKPHIIIFALCGFDIARSLSELRRVFTKRQLAELQTAVPGGVFIMDGNGLINRSGPRLVESAECLLEVMGGADTLGLFGHAGSSYLHAWSDMVAEDVFVNGGGEGGGGCGISDDDVAIEERTEKTTTPIPFENGKGTRHGDGLQAIIAEPVDVVTLQLKLLRDGAIAEAFQLNTPVNRARFCTVEKFGMILRSHPQFESLLKRDIEPAVVIPYADTTTPTPSVGNEGGDEQGVRHEEMPPTNYVKYNKDGMNAVVHVRFQVENSMILEWTLCRQDGGGYLTEKVGFARMNP